MSKTAIAMTIIAKIAETQMISFLFGSSFVLRCIYVGLFLCIAFNRLFL